MLAVALLAEGGDRNIKLPEGETLPEVALLAEGGDRNRLVMMTVPLVKVALLAEGGDRNDGVLLTELVEIGRPPRGGRG